MSTKTRKARFADNQESPKNAYYKKRNYEKSKKNKRHTYRARAIKEYKLRELRERKDSKSLSDKHKRLLKELKTKKQEDDGERITLERMQNKYHIKFTPAPSAVETETNPRSIFSSLFTRLNKTLSRLTPKTKKGGKTQKYN